MLVSEGASFSLDYAICAAGVYQCCIEVIDVRIFFFFVVWQERERTTVLSGFAKAAESIEFDGWIEDLESEVVEVIMALI